jgi:hypothetical protein
VPDVAAAGWTDAWGRDAAGVGEGEGSGVGAAAGAAAAAGFADLGASLAEDGRAIALERPWSGTGSGPPGGFTAPRPIIVFALRGTSFTSSSDEELFDGVGLRDAGLDPIGLGGSSQEEPSCPDPDMPEQRTTFGEMSRNLRLYVGDRAPYSEAEMMRKRARCILPALALGIGLSLGLVAFVEPAWADGAAVDVATPDQKLEAKTHFEVAVKLFEKEKWSEALTEFTASHAVVSSPNASFMMGRCLDKLGRSDEAYNTLIDVDAEAKGIDKYKQTQQQASDLRSELAKKVGLLKVAVVSPPSGVVTSSIKGSDVAVGREHAVMPGAFEANVIVDGKPAKAEQGNIAAGESKTVTFDLTVAPKPVEPKPIDTQPLPQPPQPNPIGPVTPLPKKGTSSTGYYVGAVILGVVGVGGFAVGIPFGVFAKNGKDELDAACPNFHCKMSDAALQTKKDSIDQDALIATIGFVAGGVASAGAITLAIVGATRPKSRDADQPSVGFVIGPGSMGLDGTF